MRTLTVVFLLVASLLVFPLPIQAQDNISITLIDAGDEGIIFGEVDPGTKDNGDVAQSSDMPAIGVKVESDTAVSVNISIRGETTGAIPLNKWKFSTTFDGPKYSVNSTYDVVYSGVSSNNTYAFYHWIDVPEDALPISYNCTISYKVDALP